MKSVWENITFAHRGLHILLATMNHQKRRKLKINIKLFAISQSADMHLFISVHSGLESLDTGLHAEEQGFLFENIRFIPEGYSVNKKVHAEVHRVSPDQRL